jgi:hypothetical protein
MKPKSKSVIYCCLLAAMVVVAFPQNQGINLIPQGKVDRVIVIENSSEERTGLKSDSDNSYSDVIGGATVHALIKAGKWKLWDKDNVPEVGKDLLVTAKASQRPAGIWQPWMFTVHNGKPTWNGPLPFNDAEFAAAIEKEGGF